MCTPIYCTQLHAPKVYVIPVIGGACQKRLQVFQWGAMWSVTGLTIPSRLLKNEPMRCEPLFKYNVTQNPQDYHNT